MNPAHNSYIGPKTQYTKFTRHREMVGAWEQVECLGAGLSLKTAGAEVVRSKQAGAPAQQSGPKARSQATSRTGEVYETPTPIPGERSWP